MTTADIRLWRLTVPVAPLWALVAVAVGIFCATQSDAVLVIGIITVALLLLSLVTPLAALIALLVLAPMRTLIATEAQFQLPLDVGQLALVAVLTVYIMYRTARKQPVVAAHWTPLLVPLLLFVLITGLSAFAATSLSAWLDEWLKWVQIVIMVVLVMNIVSAGGWEWLVFGLVLSAAANALVGIYQFFGGSGALHLVINGRFFRAFGTFGQPNPFGGFMGLIAPLALMVMVGYAIRLYKEYRLSGTVSWLVVLNVLFYATASLLILIGLVMSWSRGAWLGFVAALAVMGLALPRRTWRGVVVLAVGLLVGGLLWVSGNLPVSIVERITSSTQEFFAFEDVQGVDITPDNFAVVERLAHWEAAVRMATANPWLGVGFGNYEVAYPAYRLINWSEPLGHAHNYYLNILAEVGILGLLGYGKVWLDIIGTTWRARRHPDALARFVVIGLLGSWAYLSVHSFFDNLYVNNLFLHLGLMIGILAILYNQTRLDNKVVDQ